jgi:hypothetical protein
VTFSGMAATEVSGLALSAALDAIIGKMQDQWPGVAMIESGTAGGVFDGESERPSAGRKIERKPVFTALEHDLVATGSIFQDGMKPTGSGRPGSTMAVKVARPWRRP